MKFGINCYWGHVDHRARKGDTPWGCDGGHNMGRKLPILAAGRYLGNNAMKTLWSVTYPPNGTAANDAHEDLMRFYLQQEIVDRCAADPTFSQDSKLYPATFWNPAYKNKGGGPAPYVQGMVTNQMPDWRGGEGVPSENANVDAHPYRFVGNHKNEAGTLFVISAWNMWPNWNHDEYRWCWYRMREAAMGLPDSWITRGGTTPARYTQVAGWGFSPAAFAGSSAHELLMRYYPLTSVAPWL
jgi:hypothetical protein